jgi:hypothetical protein
LHIPPIEVTGATILALDAPSDSDRPKSPWTPSYSVTTLGPETLRSAAEAEAADLSPAVERLTTMVNVEDLPKPTDIPSTNQEDGGSDSAQVAAPLIHGGEGISVAPLVAEVTITGAGVSVLTDALAEESSAPQPTHKALNELVGADNSAHAEASSQANISFEVGATRITARNNLVFNLFTIYSEPPQMGYLSMTLRALPLSKSAAQSLRLVMHCSLSNERYSSSLQGIEASSLLVAQEEVRIERPWTPSYSVTRQGSGMLAAENADVGESVVHEQQSIAVVGEPENQSLSFDEPQLVSVAEARSLPVSTANDSLQAEVLNQNEGVMANNQTLSHVPVVSVTRSTTEEGRADVTLPTGNYHISIA